MDSTIINSALNYELDLSKSYGAIATQYENFIHLKNQYVPWSGDFNRAVNLQIVDFESLKKTIDTINQIHIDNNLEKPDRYMVLPPKLDSATWENNINSINCSIKYLICMIKHIKKSSINPSLLLTQPTVDRYFEWYYTDEKMKDYFVESEYNLKLPAITNFISIYKPYWLIENNILKGWIYCHFDSPICNVHDVWIDEKYRGKGLSRILFLNVEREAFLHDCYFLNLFTSRSKKQFYEKIGFEQYEEITEIISNKD